MTLPALPPVAGSGTPCSGVFPANSQDYYLNVLRRAYPEDYLTPIQLKPNGGYELFQSAAKVGERLSLMVARTYCCLFLATATGGAYSTGTVEFYRAVDTAGAITLVAGTVVSTDDGRQFVTTASAVFGSTDLGPVTTPVRAIAYGHEYDVPGQLVTAGGELLPGSIDQISTLLTSVPTIDPAMMVRQISATAGGADPCLDGLGNDVLIPRQPSETDDAYRLRIVQTPDAVSPGAIQRGVDFLLALYQSAGCLREVGTSKLPGIFYDAGSSADLVQDPAHNFAYDMDGTLRPEDRFKLNLDIADFRGFFMVGVPRIVAEQFGLVYDGSDSDAFPMQNAYDTTAANAPNGDYDGQVILESALYKAVWNIVNDKRAGGVGFELYIESIGCF